LTLSISFSYYFTRNNTKNASFLSRAKRRMHDLVEFLQFLDVFLI